MSTKQRMKFQNTQGQGKRQKAPPLPRGNKNNTGGSLKNRQIQGVSTAGPDWDMEKIDKERHEAQQAQTTTQCCPQCGPAPYVIERHIYQRVKALMQAWGKCEWLGYILRDDPESAQRLVIPDQKVSSASVWDVEADPSWPVEAVIHSHHDLGLHNFSGTDDSYINSNHDISVLVYNSGNDVAFTGEMKFPLPCGNTYHGDIEVQVEAEPEDDDLQEWLNQAITTLKQGRVTYGQRSRGYYYSGYRKNGKSALSHANEPALGFDDPWSDPEAWEAYEEYMSGYGAGWERAQTSTQSLALELSVETAVYLYEILRTISANIHTFYDDMRDTEDADEAIDDTVDALASESHALRLEYPGFNDIPRDETVTIDIDEQSSILLHEGLSVFDTTLHYHQKNEQEAAGQAIEEAVRALDFALSV